MKRGLGIFVTIAGLASAALPSGDVIAADARLSLPVPMGYCKFTRRNTADRRFVGVVERLNRRRNKVLVLFARCGELGRFRASGGEIDHHGGYLAPASAAGMRVSISRRVFVDQVARAARSMDWSAVDREIRHRLAQMVSKARPRNMSQVGMIDADGNAVYLCAIQSVRDSRMPMSHIATVTGLTVVRGRIVSINLSAPYEDRGSVKRLLAIQKRNVQRLIGTNPDNAG